MKKVTKKFGNRKKMLYLCIVIENNSTMDNEKREELFNELTELKESANRMHLETQRNFNVELLGKIFTAFNAHSKYDREFRDRVKNKFSGYFEL